MKPVLFLAAAALAAALPAAADEHVGYNAERGDPSRWYEPITTPEQRYANEVKEARNAAAEAKKECRSMSRDERARCEREAREQEQRDIEAAREETGYRGETRR